MGRDRSKRTTPDLFATAAVRDASASPKLPAAQATKETATQRYILPKDLHAAVKHLSDGELDLLHTAALEEIKRRGRTPRGVETDLQTLRNRFDASPRTKTQRKADNAEVPLTRGQLNAVLAAFKAGITPSLIARQSGISQWNVRKALASNKSKRCNHMTIEAHLAELERRHQALDDEIAEAVAHSSTDDLEIAELKRQKLQLKDEIERVRQTVSLPSTRE